MFSKSSPRFGAKKAAGTEISESLTPAYETPAELISSDHSRNATFLDQEKVEELSRHILWLSDKTEWIKVLIDRLRQAKLIPYREPDREYLEAGWNQIDWDQLLENFSRILKTATNKLRAGKIQIRYHENIEDVGFYPNLQDRNYVPPIFAFWTTENGKKIIHITNGLRNEALNGGDDAIFLLQMLFHEVVESELPVPDRLKHPIMTALEPLIENWEVAGAPPSISLAQKMTLHYAAERNMISYLESLVETHPLDFRKAFHQLRTQLLLQLKRKAIPFGVAFPDPQRTATLIGSAA